MKKQKLKLKIALTNLRRVIISILFINLGSISKIKAMDISCYMAGPRMPINESIWDKIIHFCQENVFILLVPIVLFVLLIIFLIKKIKKAIKTKK